MTRLHGLLLALCIFPAALSGAAEPDDFAFGLRVDMPGWAAIYKLALPEEIYRGALRFDLGDLRVFNAAGEEVAHALRQPAATVSGTHSGPTTTSRSIGSGQAP